MNYDNFLGLLNKKGFSQPSLFKHVGGKFLDFQSHPSELLAIVIEGQVDITIDGHRVSHLADKFFHIPANQIYSNSFGSKRVSYTLSCMGELENSQISSQI